MAAFCNNILEDLLNPPPVWHINGVGGLTICIFPGREMNSHYDE